MSALKRFFDPGRDGAARDFGLLLLRLGLAFGLVYGHGYGKLMRLISGEGGFPDPLGVGVQLSLALAVLAEFVCPIAIAFGFMTRLATVPVIILFVVAFFISRGFIETGLGERIAYHFLARLGGSPVGLAYGLIAADLVMAPAIPSNTARGGGVVYPVLRSIATTVMLEGLKNSSWGRYSFACSMNERQMGSAAWAPVSLEPRLLGSSKPTQTPTARFGA